MIDKQSRSAQTLRQCAEEQLNTNAVIPADMLSRDEVTLLVHKLQVHQVELEMQNEELRRSQTELDIARARYFDLYDMAPVGYCTLSKQGMILEANLTAATMLGMARKALVKQPISRFIHQEDQDIFYRHRKQLVETDAPQAFELRMVKQDGTQFWAHQAVIAAQDTDGALVSRLVMSDITERKLAEDEKEKLEVQLQQALKVESIGRLAGGVAHDFNNMLGVIIGYAELAQVKLTMAQSPREELDEISKAALRSADLTRQLLAFARRQTMSPQRVNLNDTMVGMLNMLRRLIGEDINLVWLPSAEICPVNIDPAQFHQLLANLCINARDAIAGVGTITITTHDIICDAAYCAGHAGMMPGAYIQFSISDTGCGMDTEIQSHLFEPFYTTKGVGKGTGLGMATVYGVVKQNHGFIYVESEPGHGATVTIYLPRHEGYVAHLPEQGVEELSKRGQETVLLVEDETGIRKLAQHILDLEGYHVLAAATPGEAIQLATGYAGEIHLLVTDVIMPEMNGRDLARRLLTLYPNLRRLFMSGYTADVIAHHGVLDAEVNFLQKPFSNHHLTAKVRQVLDQ